METVVAVDWGMFWGELTRRGISEESAGDPRWTTIVKGPTNPAAMPGTIGFLGELNNSLSRGSFMAYVDVLYFSMSDGWWLPFWRRWDFGMFPRA